MRKTTNVGSDEQRRAERELRQKRTAALRELVRELIERFGLDDKGVAAELDEDQNVFSDLMQGRRAFQARHITGMIALFQRFRSAPVDPKKVGIRSHLDGFRTWSKTDEYELMWTFTHGARPVPDAGSEEDALVERHKFTLGGHSQEALIYEFVPEGYRRRNISCSFDPAPLKIPVKHETAFGELEAEARHRIATTPRTFNGSGLTLSYIQSSRTAGDEEPTLTLRFKPSDYVRRVTTRNLFNRMPDTDREGILRTLADGVQEAYCGGFGVDIAIVTADHKLLFFRRSHDVAGDRGAYDCTITEASDGKRDIENGQPSVFQNALRGLAQEAALSGHQDEIHPRLKFHGVACRARFYEWAMYGSVDLSGTTLTAEVLAENAARYFRESKKWDVHLTHTSDVLSTTFALSQDAFEFQSYAAVPFSLAHVVRFIATNPVTDYAFINAVMTLISVGNVSPTAIAKELSMYPPRPYQED